MVTLNVLIAVCGVGLQESVARMPKVDVAVVVGVPERRPADESVRPAGSVPLASDHVTGSLPPEAVN